MGPTDSPESGLQLAMTLNPLDLGNLINVFIRCNKSLNYLVPPSIDEIFVHYSNILKFQTASFTYARFVLYLIEEEIITTTYSWLQCRFYEASAKNGRIVSYN